MTIPSLGGLQTALSGLLAEQAALDTAGENVANANTPGYSRQTVGLVETPPVDIPARTASGLTALGTGVEMTGITRVRDNFLDVQYRAQNSNLGSQNTLQSSLQQVQDALQEPGSNGLSAQLSAFWSSWSSLANNPSDPATRANVIAAGQNLAQSFNSLNTSLTNLQSAAGQQLAQLTGPNGQVSSDANTIASLNQQIKAAQAAGIDANSLLDQRDSTLDDLSSLAQVSTTDNGDGTINVSFGDAAQPLVSGTTVTWPQGITAAAGGTLGQLTNLADPAGTLGTYMGSLDNVANDVVTAVNGLQDPSSPFFSGSTAGTISVVATAQTLQTSATAAPGANDLAVAIAALRGGTSDQDYQTLVAGIGQDAQSNNTAQATAQALTTAASNRRESVSGVSIDEEMTNLLNFQRGYQASARVLTTMDSTLDTLINHTGTVGL
jgi:flagellar hook-associated protein 1 FlgK